MTVTHQILAVVGADLGHVQGLRAPGGVIGHHMPWALAGSPAAHGRREPAGHTEGRSARRRAGI